LKFEISGKILDKNCFVVSAASHHGLENWTKHIVDLLKKTQDYDDSIFEKNEIVDYKEYDTQMIVDSTEIEKPRLFEEGYLEEINSKYNKVWLIDNPEVSKLTVITQWGNDE
jgi:hypothetical protein